MLNTGALKFLPNNFPLYKSNKQVEMKGRAHVKKKKKEALHLQHGVK